MNSTSVASLAGLAQMITAVEARRAQLLHELRQAERDLETVRQTMEVAARLGFLDTNSQAPSTRQQTTLDGDRAPLQAPPAPPSPSRSSRTRSSKGVPDTTLTLEALRTLGPARNDKEIPPKAHKGRRVETSGAPMEGPQLQAIRDSVQEIARKAAAAPPGPGGRRYKSTRALVPGEPIAPSLMAILRAADRPLTSHEAAVAMLEARGLRLEGQELAAVTNRASALLGQQARAGHVQRLRTDGLRQVRWVVRPDGQSRLT